MATIREIKPYRILSLDGGGTWALIQVKVLMKIYGEDAKGHQVLADFDMVAANSGGSIVAAGLIANMPLAEILRLFLDESNRKKMFVKLWFYQRFLGFLGPRFSTEEKRNGLSQVLHGLATDTLQSIRIPNQTGREVHFVIAAYDYDRDRATFFRSDVNSPAANFPHAGSAISVIDAVHASSTAPVDFFDKPAVIGDKRYWDGGVSGFNNPVLAAVLEAIAYNIPKENIGVLSIGTGNVFLPLGGVTADPVLVQKKQELGFVNDITKLARAIVADPPDSDSFIAHVTLGGALPGNTDDMPVKSSIVRLNPLIRPRFSEGKWCLPVGCASEDFRKLIEMDLAVIDQKDVLLVQAFCNSWTENYWPNQPIRHGADGNRFCEIGDPDFSSALARW